MVYEHIIRSSSQIRTFDKSVTNNTSNGSQDITIATITNEALVIDSVIIYAAAAQPAELTSCAVYGGASKVVTFIDAATALGPTLPAIDKQLAWTGAVYLPSTKTIVMTLIGTGVAATNMLVLITYHTTKNGGYLV